MNWLQTEAETEGSWPDKNEWKDEIDGSSLWCRQANATIYHDIAIVVY